VSAVRERGGEVAYLRYDDEGHGNHTAPQPARLLSADLSLPRTASRPCLTAPIWRGRARASRGTSGARRRCTSTRSTWPAGVRSGSSPSASSAPAASSSGVRRTRSRGCRGARRASSAISSGNHAQAVARAAREAGIGCLARDADRLEPGEDRRDRGLRRRGRARGRHRREPRADRPRARGRARLAADPPVRRLGRALGPGHRRARAARGCTGARHDRDADRRWRAALGHGARLRRVRTAGRRLGRRARLRRRRLPLAGRRQAHLPRAGTADAGRRGAHAAGRRAAVLDPARALRRHRARRGGRAARGARAGLVAHQARDRADLGAADRGGAAGRDPRRADRRDPVGGNVDAARVAGRL